MTTIRILENDRLHRREPWAKVFSAAHAWGPGSSPGCCRDTFQQEGRAHISLKVFLETLVAFDLVH